MLEYKWCVVEIRENLLKTEWEIIKQIAPKVKTYQFEKWLIEKGGHRLELELYHSATDYYDPIYNTGLITYACKIKGTDLGLGFLEYYQKELWMEKLQKLIETLNYNYNLVNFGGHLVKELSVNEAFEIAKAYIYASPKMSAKIRGISWTEAWIDGHRNVDDHVWIVSADNLNTGPFIDGVNTYNIVIGIKSKIVEDLRLM